MTSPKTSGRAPKPASRPQPRGFDIHQHRKWHDDWVIDERQRIAQHVSGVIYDFRPGASPAVNPPYSATCGRGEWHGVLRGDTTSKMSRNPHRAERICLEACVRFGDLAWDLCQDCSTHTGGSDYYMVTNQLWEEAHPQIVGMLCMSCLEARIGRKLVLEDFANVPVNLMNAKVLAIRKQQVSEMPAA